jgi:hypothetical protein
MAIGTTAAIIGSAVIGAGASMLSGSAQKKAAAKASDAETAMARENNALATQFRAENTANFQPWMQSGGRGNALVDSFLYGAPQAGTQGTQQYGAPQPVNTQQPVANWAQSAWNNIAPMIGPKRTAKALRISDPEARIRYIEGDMHRDERQAYQQWVAANPRMTASSTPMSQVPQSQPQGTPANAMSGYDAFVASPYYQNPLNEGYRALNHGLASKGMIESGAAMKDAIKWGSDYGAGRMDEFIGMAERQSDRGLQGASAIAGVGQNALASMSANNRAIGDSQANRAIAGGVANANMWSGIGSAVGGALGGLTQSSYGGGFGGYGRYPY